MRIGMRLLLGYFLLVAVAAWFVLAIFGLLYTSPSPRD